MFPSIHVYAQMYTSLRVHSVTDVNGDLRMQNLRLTKTEDKLITQKCIEVNKVLVNNNHPPVKESELAHRVLSEALPKIRADRTGRIYIDL